MKLQIPIIACLLVALPAAALADPPQQQWNAQQGDHQRGSQQTPHEQYQAPREPHQAPRDQYQAPREQYQAPREQYQAPRDQRETPRYQAAPQEYQQQRYVQHDDRRDVRPWEWNGGRTWVASPRYWGGGFWGAFSVDLNFNNYQGGGQYYEVQPSSPGADLLQQYGLQQTDCDQPNLVDITGPDGGEVCAYPNNEVAAGQYQVDPSTLTLISD
jgi:hypothetical protein